MSVWFFCPFPSFHAQNMNRDVATTSQQWGNDWGWRPIYSGWRKKKSPGPYEISLNHRKHWKNFRLYDANKLLTYSSPYLLDYLYLQLNTFLPWVWPSKPYLSLVFPKLVNDNHSTSHSSWIPEIHWWLLIHPNSPNSAHETMALSLLLPPKVLHRLKVSPQN